MVEAVYIGFWIVLGVIFLVGVICAFAEAVRAAIPIIAFVILCAILGFCAKGCHWFEEEIAKSAINVITSL